MRTDRYPPFKMPCGPTSRNAGRLPKLKNDHSKLQNVTHGLQDHAPIKNNGWFPVKKNKWQIHINERVFATHASCIAARN